MNRNDPNGQIHDTAAVLATHDQFWDSYAQRDLDARFAVCAEDVTFFGTGLHERAVGKAQYRAMNQKGVEQYPHAFTIEYIWKEVRHWGEVAWVEGDTFWLMGSGESASKDLIRQTTILKKVEGEWLVAHVHGSDPDYRLREGEHMTHGRVFARNAELEREVAERTRELREEKKRSDDLLLNILPEEVAEELKAKGHAEAKHFDTVTIILHRFQRLHRSEREALAAGTGGRAEHLLQAHLTTSSPRTVSRRSRPSVTPTCARAGWPDPKSSTPLQVVYAALEMQAFMMKRKKERDAARLACFRDAPAVYTRVLWWRASWA
jgi:ketosteroid isomerase-like protein